MGEALGNDTTIETFLFSECRLITAINTSTMIYKADILPTGTSLCVRTCTSHSQGDDSGGIMVDAGGT